MSQINTPEQIAAEVWEEGGVRHKESREEVLWMVAEAVRRDRAQRPHKSPSAIARGILNGVEDQIAIAIERERGM